MSRFGVFLVVVIALNGCSLLDKMVYRIDIPQGNYLEQEDVDKLRVGMTEEQVVFVLGNPVAENSFDSNRWVYLYEMDPNSGEDYRKELVLTFNNKQLQGFEGDFDKPENFDQPLDQ